MQYEFFLEGEEYSKNKAEFKRILRKNGLRWKGTMGDFIWESDEEKVWAFFERDEVKDKTLSAKLVLECRSGAEVYKDLKEWVSSLKGRVEARKQKMSEVEKRIKKELEFWDTLHKPPLELLRQEGRPEEWIRLDMKKWKAGRKKKEEELRARYG